MPTSMLGRMVDQRALELSSSNLLMMLEMQINNLMAMTGKAVPLRCVKTDSLALQVVEEVSAGVVDLEEDMVVVEDLAAEAALEVDLEDVVATPVVMVEVVPVAMIVELQPLLLLLTLSPTMLLLAQKGARQSTFAM